MERENGSRKSEVPEDRSQRTEVGSQLPEGRGLKSKVGFWKTDWGKSRDESLESREDNCDGLLNLEPEVRGLKAED